MMRQFPVGTLTLLFTDIEGSTRLLRQLGRQYADMLRECRRLMRAAFAHSHGFEVDTQGDAFFVVFERASDAIMAAVIAQHSLAEAHWPEDVTVRVRMGVHTGEPQAVEEGYVGLDVHHAARIMGAAHGGQVLLSQATHDLVANDLPDEVGIQDLGSYRLKDIPGQSRLFQLVIPGLPETFPPPATAGSRRSLRPLPQPSASFVGREQEVEILCQQLLRPGVRLLTLIGIGGVGKTRLALQVASTLAERLASEICFVALEEAHSSDEVLSTLARALGIQEEQGTPLLGQIKTALADQPLLLVLDNFEHVLSARLAVAELLTSCPGLKMLVTSRTMLHLQAEHLFEVQPFPLPNSEQAMDLVSLSRSAAIALFVQRAQALQPDFELTAENAPDILRICGRLDGIPLAIELAAAQSRYFTTAQLLERLQQESMQLQGKVQDIPARQRTLQQAIDWSYDLLEPAEQRVFRRLSVCPAAITREAAEQICTAAGPLDKPIVELLENLVDKSMLQRRGGNGEARFWQLRTLRTYGSTRLAEAAETETTLSALGSYSVSRCEEIAPRLAGAEQVFWLDQLDQDYENIREAAAWLLNEHNPDQTRSEQAQRLGVALMRYWEIRGYFEEGASLLTQALASPQEVPATIRAQALHSAGFLALMLSQVPQAEAFLRESQLLFRESGDKSAMAAILRLQGNLALTKNSYKVARRLLEEALTIDREGGNTRRAASTRIALAQIAIAQGSYSKAYALLEENLAEYASLGEQDSTAYPLYYMARTLFLSDQNIAKAQELVEDSLNLFRAVGNRRLVAHALDLQANILMGRKDRQAAQLLDESSQLFKAIADPMGRAEVLISQGRLASSRNDWQQARASYEESLAILKQLEAKEMIAAGLEGYGSVLVVQQAPERAIQCWGLAASIRSTIVAPMPPVYRTSYRLALSLARAQLDPARFQAAWQDGSQATLISLLP
ncbi:ATP-binding protein [Dictyobacter aurantiacus]|uniref:LuxR family transcriptional regulator n=1 Tax=Dictyobacter aurantiacus TaxID=1936993 RepID=A0A401ZL60_9CHLR|nr:adenylate/guanylate cyclase domain-containing protein [Dictyobacter aurantiacus]GCE07562.1 LuxR family transcriptional regulator [Dictyobacter aurantiacus]